MFVVTAHFIASSLYTTHKLYRKFVFRIFARVVMIYMVLYVRNV
jgi:hypothetical protein